MAYRADEYALSPNERNLNQFTASDNTTHVLIPATSAAQGSGRGGSAFLCALTPVEIIALFEADEVEVQAGLFGEVSSVLDLFHNRSCAQEYLRRAVAGETLQMLSKVGGSVFEIHLIPIRNQHNEVTTILCNAISMMEDVHPVLDARLRERYSIQTGEILPTTEAQTLALLDAIPDCIFLLNHEGVFLSYKAAPDHLPSVTIGTHITQILSPPVVLQFLDAMQQARETRSVQLIEYPLQIGEIMQFMEVRIVTTEQNEYMCISRNITARKHVEQDLRDSEERNRTEYVHAEEVLRLREERYHMIVSNAPIMLFAADTNGVITLAEGQGFQNLGVLPEHIVGYSIFKVFSDIPVLIDAVQRVLAGETVCRIIQIDDVTSKVQYTPLWDHEGNVSGLIGVATDISERVQAEEVQRHLALYDQLTDLPNRTLLLEQIAEASPAAELTGNNMALFILDLDRFKEVNDTFGHQCGDQLLQQVGLRLRQAVGASAMMARLGGDEFAVFLSSTDEKCAQELAFVLDTALEEPFLIDEYSLHVEMSTGIALYPAHGSDPLTLLQHADVALYIAKGEHERHAFYSVERDRHNPRRLTLLGDLRKAIDVHELRLYYQPKAELNTGLIKDVEALVRWQHPTHGFIPPDQFIPLAEQTGLIEPLTHWVVETAIQQCRHWLDSGITLGVSVNLSMRNLRDVHLPDTIASLLVLYDVPPHLLTCEVTESAAMADAEQTLLVLMRLSTLGVHISIDDYGTGYASLSYLKRLPANELKIDRAFVQHLITDPADQAIVRSTVTMAHSLGMVVVAEGVEDQETWNLLTALECDIAQGYYLSRPVPAQDLGRWLEEKKEVVASYLASARSAAVPQA